MKKDTPEMQYKKYIAEVKRQLEETSNMTYDEFYKLYSHKF